MNTYFPKLTCSIEDLGLRTYDELVNLPLTTLAGDSEVGVLAAVEHPGLVNLSTTAIDRTTNETYDFMSARKSSCLRFVAITILLR